MTYVISDLHGYRIEKLKKLLEKTNFSEATGFTYSAT